MAMEISSSPELRCPVCSTLPFKNIPLENKTLCLEYIVNLDPQNRKALQEWLRISRCDLVQLICDLSDYWSGESGCQEFQSHMSMYPRACDDNNNKTTSWRKLLFLAADFDSFLSTPIKQVAVHPDPLSTIPIARLQHWLNNCNLHEKCKNDFETMLPTRVLDVQDVNCIKLHISGHQRDRYVALSHCWGAPQPFVTTHSTLDEMKKGFSLEDAPKTFQDAILVTRILNIRYLWIDSLCIIQRDKEDWIIESAKMSEVYTNAYLTIGAARADGDLNGFLDARQTRYTALKISSEGGKSAQIYLHSIGKPSMASEEPLDARAWTLQEQYLSPRTIRFCKNQMVWMCKQGAYQENQTDDNGALDSSKGVSNALWNLSWNELVTEYTRRALTYDSDKLPALAGLAVRLAESHDNKYVAGLWYDEMPHCLLWEVEIGGERNMRLPSRYLAPSWSWASLNFPISYLWAKSNAYSTSRPLETAQMHGYHIQTSEQNPYGAVEEGAYLKLSAPLVMLNVLREVFRLPGLGHYRLKHDKVSDVEVYCRFDFDQDESKDTEGLILSYRYDITKAEAQKTLDSDPQNWTTLMGILIRGSKHGENTYERVGTFKLFNMKPGKAISILENHPPREVIIY